MAGIGYIFKRSAAWLSSRGVLAGLTGAAAGYGTPVGIIGVGLGVGITASLAQADHIHRRYELLDFYRPEIEAKLHKAGQNITLGDLDQAAERNPIVLEAAHRSALRRTVAVGACIIAAAAVFTAAPLLLPGFFATASFATQLLVGVGAYIPLRETLRFVGKKCFQLDKTISHDHIVALEHQHRKGKTISGEQVMGVMVAANLGLAQAVEARYGAEYDRLPLAFKQDAAQQFKLADLAAALAQDINNGQVRPGELAFAAVGDASGVERLPEPVVKAPSVLSRAISKGKDGLSHAAGKVKQLFCHPKTGCAMVDADKVPAALREQLEIPESVHRERELNRRAQGAQMAMGHGSLA